MVPEHYNWPWGSLGRGDSGRTEEGRRPVPGAASCADALWKERVGVRTRLKTKTNVPSQVRVKTLKGEKTRKPQDMRCWVK